MPFLQWLAQPVLCQSVLSRQGAFLRQEYRLKFLVPLMVKRLAFLFSTRTQAKTNKLLLIEQKKQS